jgi:hypothetical protein
VASFKVDPLKRFKTQGKQVQANKVENDLLFSREAKKTGRK